MGCSSAAIPNSSPTTSPGPSKGHVFPVHTGDFVTGLLPRPQHQPFWGGGPQRATVPQLKPASVGKPQHCSANAPPRSVLCNGCSRAEMLGCSTSSSWVHSALLDPSRGLCSWSSADLQFGKDSSAFGSTPELNTAPSISSLASHSHDGLDLGTICFPSACVQLSLGQQSPFQLQPQGMGAGRLHCLLSVARKK